MVKSTDCYPKRAQFPATTSWLMTLKYTHTHTHTHTHTPHVFGSPGTELHTHTHTHTHTPHVFGSPGTELQTYLSTKEYWACKDLWLTPALWWIDTWTQEHSGHSANLFCGPTVRAPVPFPSAVGVSGEKGRKGS